MKQSHLLALAFVAVGLSGCSSTLAFLDEDENGQTFEQRAIQDSLANIGVVARKQEVIEYKERKGLKMPTATTQLPQPVETYDPKKQAVQRDRNAPIQHQSAMKPAGMMSYEEQQVGKGSGEQLVTSPVRVRDRSANPNELDYSEWRAGEDKARQGDMARGEPVQGNNAVSALDWNLSGKNDANKNVDLSSLKTADKSRKTVYDPPSNYREPAPMDHLKPEEVEKVRNAEKKNGWWPF